ncbi:MAG: hypothetical protein EOO91_03420 [Pedobacter sp.]|nr:MAG: hypothetical protein EOO91_03420 [Pedobacter sp.]
MISIIIASVNKELLKQVSSNVATTIGVDYEIIAVDNSAGQMGICELYNKAAEEAKYDVLCFMHEDILVKTEGWGEIVVKLFKGNPKLGLLGVAGSQYKSLAPSSWHSYQDEAPELLYYNLIQSYKFTQKDSELRYSNPTNENLVQAICLDGLWLCSTRGAFASYGFDQQLLKGFHGYDLDLSLGIGRNFEVAVTFDVLIEHFSEGNMNKSWTEEVLKVHNKWLDVLPLGVKKLTRKQEILLEKRGFRTFINRMKIEGFSFFTIQRFLWRSRKSEIFTKDLFIKLELHLMKIFFKKDIIKK